MKPSDALSEVRKDLTEAFGEGLTARILFNARDTVGAPVIGLEKGKFIEIVRAVSADERVKGMWGDFGAKEKLKKWETLV